MGLANKRRRAAERALKELYDSLPALNCKGLCQDSCHISESVVAPIERLRITERSGSEPVFPSDEAIMAESRGEGGCTQCPLLSLGSCSVYHVRPLLCRLWGAVDDPLMRCPYGCKPDRYMTNVETQRLWAKLREISERYFFGARETSN
jgi:Fe-S-cluster containining protein